MGAKNLDKSIFDRITWAVILTAITLVAEIIGGIWTNSLALLSDAAHVFLDVYRLCCRLGYQAPNSNSKSKRYLRWLVFVSSTYWLVCLRRLNPRRLDFIFDLELE